MSKFTRLHTFFAIALTVSEKFKLLILESRLLQGHGVQFSQRHHSLANVKIYKGIPAHYAIVLTVSDTTILNS